MKDCIEFIKGIQKDWNRSEFFPPASKTAVSEFEKKDNIMIPHSYKEFLYLSNGAHLFGGDIYLYSVNLDEKFKINYDFSEGNVPKELLILGYYRPFTFRVDGLNFRQFYQTGIDNTLTITK